MISLRDPGLAGDEGHCNGGGGREFDKIHLASELGGDAGLSRPSDLLLGERRTDCDYSFMSSCSLPSENPSPSSPSLPQERVVFRHSDRNNEQVKEELNVIESILIILFSAGWTPIELCPGSSLQKTPLWRGRRRTEGHHSDVDKSHHEG